RRVAWWARSAVAQVVLGSWSSGRRLASPSTEVTASSPASALSRLVPTFPLAPVTTTRIGPPFGAAATPGPGPRQRPGRPGSAQWGRGGQHLQEQPGRARRRAGVLAADGHDLAPD